MGTCLVIDSLPHKFTCVVLLVIDGLPHDCIPLSCAICRTFSRFAGDTSRHATTLFQSNFYIDSIIGQKNISKAVGGGDSNPSCVEATAWLETSTPHISCKICDKKSIIN